MSKVDILPGIVIVSVSVRKVKATTMFAPQAMQNVMELQTPRAQYGKISELMVQGIGPKPGDKLGKQRHMS
ncbi:hypothetical protein RRG08_067340 [Elysia crispata]|uniref:Uncharacterized protein n=1 Tax=Elysia crispata TaxID=231223 RepID=A0AAE1EDQ3_9GAST|nr:hypothetical protein RRG08_067340 [Elysia crispata]